MSAVEQDLRPSREQAAGARNPELPASPVARSVGGRLLRRLRKSFGDPRFAFVLWTGERIAAESVGAVTAVRIANRATLLGLLRDPRLRFGDAYSEGRIDVAGD